MATCNWPGASGQTYPYEIYAISLDPNPGIDGNYIFAKLTPDNKWQPVYVGEGDLKTRIAAAKNDGCVTRKSATHIHVHPNGNAAARKREESDILAKHPIAYAPTGCNVKPGG